MPTSRDATPERALWLSVVRGARLGALAMAASLGACATTPVPSDEPPVAFTELAPGVWMHTSYKRLPKWGLVRSNGLVVETADGGAFMVDTAWNDPQTRQIMRWSSARGRPIVGAVFTHAHDDKMGGVAALRADKIPTFAHPLSNLDAPARGLTPAEYDLAFDAAGIATLAAGGIEVMYPGPGHTRDNIVAYVPAARLLFGGCLIRPGGSKSLGNTADGNVETWGPSVRNVEQRYSAAKIVVPSHGPPKGPELLPHTIDLAAEHLAKTHPAAAAPSP